MTGNVNKMQNEFFVLWSTVTSFTVKNVFKKVTTPSRKMFAAYFKCHVVPEPCVSIAKTLEQFFFTTSQSFHFHNISMFTNNLFQIINFIKTCRIHGHLHIGMLSSLKSTDKNVNNQTRRRSRHAVSTWHPQKVHEAPRWHESRFRCLEESGVRVQCRVTSVLQEHDLLSLMDLK